MPSYKLEPVSLVAPTATNSFLAVYFRLPSDPQDPIYPATRLQISLEDRTKDMEVFVEAVTSREVAIDEVDSTRRFFKIPQSELPMFARGSAGSSSVPPATLTVKLHAWMGEKWLGTWQLGAIEKESIPALKLEA